MLINRKMREPPKKQDDCRCWRQLPAICETHEFV